MIGHVEYSLFNLPDLDSANSALDKGNDEGTTLHFVPSAQRLGGSVVA